jgi:hypothetical protein
MNKSYQAEQRRFEMMERQTNQDIRDLGYVSALNNQLKSQGDPTLSQNRSFVSKNDKLPSIKSSAKSTNQTAN